MNLDKKQLQDKLREKAKAKSVTLPRDLDMNLHQGILTMTIHNACGNMQTDSAAFEAWALVMKATDLPIHKIVLNVLNVTSIVGFTTNQKLHYNRFLWRALEFESVFSWFHIGNFRPAATTMQNQLDLAVNMIRINQPGGVRTKPQKSTGEVYVEWLFANTYNQQLCNATGCDFLVNQFPVGIFTNTVSEATKFFNGSKSAIDLVGLEKPNIIHIFELKVKDNRKVGILSEFLFYAFVLEALFIRQQFSFERPLTQDGFKDFNKLKAKQIKGHLLAENYHPLLTQEVLALVNTGLNPKNISLDALSYQRDQDIILNIKPVMP